jgi:hypothetical protein
MKGFILVGRILALPCIYLGLIFLYDIFSSQTSHDVAIVTGKTEYQGSVKSGGTTYYVYAKGQSIPYKESVFGSFYNDCQNGDQLDLVLTPIYKDWRLVTLIRDGKVIEQYKVPNFYWGQVVSFFFLAPIGFFLPKLKESLMNLEISTTDLKWLQSNSFGILLALFVCEFAGLIGFGKLIALFLGWSDRM